MTAESLPKKGLQGETGCCFPDTQGRGTRNTIPRQCSPLRHLPWWWGQAWAGVCDPLSKPRALPNSLPRAQIFCDEDGGHWPPSGVAGGLGREKQPEVARDAWDSWSEGGPHTEVPPFSFFLLLLSCGFHGILSPGSGSEYNPGLAHPDCLLFPCQHQCGVERSVGETGKGSRVSSVGRLWAVPGWAPEVAVETTVVQASGPILVPAVEP